MKFFISLILTALLSLVLCLFFPWWTVAVAAFAVAALIPQRPFASFGTGFLAIFLLWIFLSWYISQANGHVFIHKISILILKMDNPLVLVLVTAFIGALVAGFGALTGSFVRKR